MVLDFPRVVVAEAVSELDLLARPREQTPLVVRRPRRGAASRRRLRTASVSPVDASVYAHRELAHAAKHQRVGSAVPRSARCGESRQHGGRLTSPSSRAEKTEADMQPEAKREVRHAVALQVDPVGLRVGAGVAVRGVDHQEDSLALPQRPAVQLMLDLDDPPLRGRRAVVAQQLFHGARCSDGSVAKLALLTRKAHQREQSVGDVVGGGLVAGRGAGCRWSELVLGEAIAAVLQVHELGEHVRLRRSPPHHDQGTEEIRHLLRRAFGACVLLARATRAADEERDVVGEPLDARELRARNAEQVHDDERRQWPGEGRDEIEFVALADLGEQVGRNGFDVRAHRAHRLEREHLARQPPQPGMVRRILKHHPQRKVSNETGDSSGGSLQRAA